MTYAADKALSCSDGTKTLLAKTASGSWQFGVPNAGAWLVSDGENHEVVEITEQGQVVDVNFGISWDGYLIKDGVLQTEFVVTNRKASTGVDTVATFTNNEYEASSGTHVLYILNAGGNTWSSNSIETEESFDVSDFSALNIQGWYIHGGANATGDSYAYCYEGDAPTYSNDCPGTVAFSKNTETTVTIPLEGFKSVKVGIQVSEYNINVAARIRNMWFS